MTARAQDSPASESRTFRLSLAVILRDGYTYRPGLVGRAGFEFDGEPKKSYPKPEGAYAFTGLATGRHNMTVRAAEYFALQETVEVPSRPRLDSAVEEFVLSPRPSYPYPAGTTLVRGLVRGGGDPLAGVRVTVLYDARPRNGPVTQRNVETQTDDRGNYAGRFAVALPGFAAASASVTLELRLAGWQPVVRQAQAERGKTTQIEVTMEASS